MTPLEVGVIGVGHLGSLHAKMLSQIQSVHLAGIYDLDAARAGAVAAEFSTRAYGSLEELLEEVQALTIATTTSTHYDVACRALERGRHLFIEKPITATVGEARSLIARAAQAGCVIQVGHIERFNPAILALEKYQLNPLFVESHRLSQFNPRGTDVAVVLDLMIHDIDIILSFVRSPVRQVDASGVAVVSDSVDIANARLQFENGCVANVTASRISQRKMRKMRLFQPNTYISIDFSEGTSEVFRLARTDESPGASAMVVGELGSGDRRRRILYEQPQIREVNALSYELELFARAIREGERPVVSGEDGLRALEVAGIIMDKISAQRVSL